MNLDAFHPTRRAMIRGLLAASGFAPLMVAMLARAGANSKVPVVPGIQRTQGDVRINASPAQVGGLVQPGDTVRTGTDGECVIIIGEHVYLIRENSEVTFYSEDFELSEEGAVSGVIRIAYGAMLSVFGKTDTQFVTPFATIGIRGTACYIHAKPDSTYACVCYGRAELSGTQDGKLLETVVSEHHDKPRTIYPEGAGARIVPDRVMDHTDVELRMLEALVNRKPPFDDNPDGIDY